MPTVPQNSLLCALGPILGCVLLWGCAATPVAPVEPDRELAVGEVMTGDWLRRRGLAGKAEVAYRRAVEIDAGSIRAHAGLQEIEVARGRELALREVYRKLDNPFLIGRLEVSAKRQKAAFERAQEPWKSIGGGMLAWRKRGWAEGARHFSQAVRADPGCGTAQVGLGRSLLGSGALGEAEAAFERARWIDPGDPITASAMSLIDDQRGSLREAFFWALRAYRAAPGKTEYARRLRSVALRANLPTVWERTVEEFTSIAGKGEAGQEAQAFALLYAGELLERLGRSEEAERVWQRSTELGITGAEIEAIRSVSTNEVLSPFVSTFVRGVETRYRHFAATGEAEDFNEFLAWAQGLYSRLVGEALAESGPVIDYAFVGKLVDPTANSNNPLVRALARHGLLLVIGQRSGGPPEALLADIVRREAMAKTTVRGLEVEREVVWIGRRYLSGYQEWSGGGDLAGLALERLVMVDLHAIAGWQGRIERLVSRLEPEREPVMSAAALADRPVTAIDDPAGVATRLYLSAPFDVAGDVLAHEDGHLVDAALHLPVGSHTFRNLGLAISRGFSTNRILAFLERNAQLAAIAEGPSPLGSLATCCERIGNPGVHAEGYTEIVTGMIGLIHDHPERYPQIDPDRVIVQQLHRLGADQVRTLARELLDEWNLTR